MEMFINIMGVGVALPKTGLGVNLATGSYIGITMGHTKTLLGVSKCMSIGAGAGTLVAGWVKTAPFHVSPAKHGWATNVHGLIGKKVQIELTGTLVVFGKVDLTFTVFDKDGGSKELISRVDIESCGMQASETKVRGVLCKMN